MQGPDGFRGMTGDKGRTGDQGPVGFQGPVGLPGGSTGLTGYTGFAGSSRSSSDGYTRRVNSSNTLVTQASQTPQNRNILLFATSLGIAGSAFTDNRMSFYHIGESVDLEKLDSRVTTLMSNIATAIP
jgi:hypothetical protein